VGVNAAELMRAVVADPENEGALAERCVQERENEESEPDGEGASCYGAPHRRRLNFPKCAGSPAVAYAESLLAIILHAASVPSLDELR
jgi:hypothetical protein